MKSYTDLEQSKKLAEILPPESADMEYIFFKEGNVPVGKVPFVKDNSEVENSAFSFTYNRVPCWSLAALLEQLPCEICDDEGKTGNISIYNENDKYQLVYNSSFYEDFDDIETDVHENLVDACVSMIESLYELNLI